MSVTVPIAVRRSDAGFTLIELIIYISFSVLILALVGGFLLNAVRAESEVNSAAQAANSAQLVAESIKRDVRNATRVEVVSENLLVVETAGMAETIEVTCRSWYFDSASHALYSTNAAVAAAPTTTEEWAAWTEKSQKIRPVNSTEPVFATADQGQLKLSFTVGGATPVVVHTSVTARLLIDTGGTCFTD